MTVNQTWLRNDAIRRLKQAAAVDADVTQALGEATRRIERGAALLAALHRLACRWEAAGDRAHADELRDAVRVAHGMRAARDDR